MSVVVIGDGVLAGDDVGGVAGSTHNKDLVGVYVGVLVSDGVDVTSGTSHCDVVGVFSGVGEGGIAGAAHRDLTDSDVLVLPGDDVGGIDGSVHDSVVFGFGELGGGVVVVGVISWVLVGGGVCS